MAILSVKLKNDLKKAATKAGLNLEFSKLNNILINGEKRGCSGFIHDIDKDLWCYVNTEGIKWNGCKRKCHFRCCDNDKDYSGKRNQFAEEDVFVSSVISLFLEGNHQWSWNLK